MGKVLIAINTAGFFLNVLVFLMVVNLSGGEQAAPEKANVPAAPSLEAIAGKIEQIVEKKLSRLAAMDTKLQSLASKMEALSRKVASPPPAAALPSAVQAVEQPAGVAETAPETSPQAAEKPGGPSPAPAETKPEEHPENGEKATDNPQEGNE